MSTDPAVDFDGDDATLRIKTRQVESLDTQKKTFMKWINSRLTRSGLPVISDVFKDLRDGAQLLLLLGLLSGRHLKPERGCMRVHHLNNVNHAIRFLEEEYGIKLVNISSDDIVDGNPKLTLGLLWNIILHWQAKDVLKECSPERHQSNLEKTLLQWCQQSTTGYKGVSIVNLTTSFSDGLAFNALLHHYCPELFIYDNLLQNSAEMNLIHAFKIAEEKFGIERILDAEDLMIDAPDKKSVMIYLMCCLQVFEKGSYSGRAASTSSSLDPGAAQSSDELLQESLDYFDQNVPLHQVVTDASGYQKLLEPVITWLLTAKEATSMLEPISRDVQTVKRQFQDHESFMESLTLRQDHVGRLLQRGHSAIQADGVSVEDRYQIEAQMLLLNAQWEELRIAAMDRQTSLQRSLTELQQEQLDQLHDWLEIMEGNIQLLKSNTSTLGNFQQQIEKHKEVQEEIGKQQEHVNSLHSMVVVVDDSNSDEAYVVLEHQLEQLGQRWGNVCLWAENRWIVLQQSLQNTVCRRVEFSEKQSHFLDWLLNTSAMLSEMPLVKDSDFHQLSEQIICLKNLESELDKWMSHFDELTALAEMLMRDDAESGSNLEPQLKLLHAEWDKIVHVMEEKSKEIMQSGVELKERKGFDGSDHLTIVRLQESRDVQIGGPAVAASVDVPPSNKRPCTNGETEIEVGKHKKYFHELRNAGESLEVKAETDDGKEIDEPMHSIQQMQNRTKDVAERRAEAMLLLNELMHLHGIATMYESVTEKMATAPVDSVENQQHLDLCKQNLDELKSYEFQIQKLADRVQSFLTSGSDELQLEKSLTDLSSHWADVVQKFGEHQLLMNESLEKTPPPYYFDAMGAFKCWIEGAEHVLETEPFSLADLEVMDHRLQQFKSLHTDVLDHQKNYDYLWQTGSSLTARNPNQQLSSELNELASRWNKLLSSVKKRVGEYDVVVEKLTVLEKIRELEKWTDDATEKTADFLIQSNGDIAKAQAKIKVLQDEIAKQSVCLVHIKKSVDNLREDSAFVGIAELPRSLTQLETKFLELNKLAEDLSRRFCTDVEAASEFKALLKEEQLWLDQLELLLSKGPGPSEDAEELSEELDELENFVGIRDAESNARLEELAKSLTYNGVLSETVAVDWSDYNQRTESVLERAKMQARLLEERVTNAQNRESQILFMTQWMVEANDLIQSHLDADLLAGDVPKDYESLKSEFEQQEKILAELETDLTRFRKESKTDAAERLEQQISLLRRHVAEVSPKFKKFQRPMEFESKMTYIERILGEIEQQCLIDMQSHDPEVMQQQLSHCLNFYKTMSEIKSEVEHVIKTGRQIVEKKQVGFPDQLNAQIDAIKHQYNKLGTQITRTKSWLEKMLKLTKSLNNELTSIQSFVDQTNDELRCRKNSIFPKDFQEELEWIEANELEITRRQQTLVSLGDIVGQMAKLAEENSVNEPENSLKVVTEALQDLKEQLGKQKSTTQSLIEASNSRQPQSGPIMMSVYESAESECQEQSSVVIPEEMAPMVQMLGFDWSKPKSMMINDVQDVSCTFERELGSLSPSTAHEKLFTEEALSEIALSRAEITESPRKQFYKGAASNLDRFLANLRNFMGLMLDKSKPVQVLIGDVLEIEAAVKKEKMKLIELTAMKPHIAALAEKSEMSKRDASEEDMKLLTDSIECLGCEWESSVKRVNGRLKELEEMLADCQAFEQTRLEFIVWMSEMKVAFDSCPLDAELQEIQNLQSKVTNHTSSFDQLDQTGRKLVETYIRDDPSKIEAMIEDVKQMWTEFLTRSQLGFGVNQQQEKDLLKNINMLTLWIADKSTELSSHRPVISDLATIRSQIERHQVLKGELEDWLNHIEETLKAAGITQEMEELSVIQNGDMQDQKSVKVLAESLRRKWNDLNRMLEKQQNELDESFEKMILMQEAVDDLTQHLNEAEKEMADWNPVHDIHFENLQQQVDHTQIFQQRTAPIQGEVDQCIDMAAQFSDTKFSALDGLVRRWQNLQNVVETRLLKLQESLCVFGRDSQHTLSDSVTLPWERGVAANKVPYYINHESKKTFWFHPEMSALMNSLATFNDVRFSAYRTAMKLRRIQDQLHFDLLSLENVIKAFGQMDGLRVQLDSTVGTIEMIACLLSLYETHASTLKVPLTVDLVLNWILNVFDSNRSGLVRLLSFKVAIILMCNAHYNDKYRCLFQLVADVSGTVDQRRLGLLLHDCIQVPKQLGEVAAFGGSNIEPSVRSCFEKTGNRSSIEVTHFMDWMKLEPQSLVWIPVMQRLKMAEGLRHQAKCTVCKATPISGLRYRCLKCFKFDLCQTCFFSGRTVRSHKLNHPMQEYSTGTTSGEDMRDFTKVFKNKFRSKRYFQKHPRLGYLPVQTVLEGDVLESPSPITSSSPLHNMSLEIHSSQEQQADRLTAYEQKIEASKERDDEHSLIVCLCQSLRENQSQSLQSPMQIIVDTDAGQKEELEQMIRDLEADNQCLQAELDQLRHASADSGVLPFLPLGESRSYDEAKDAELIEEARQLQHHKSHLEVRMKILEDHNRQLEVQLYRLRRLLDQPPAETRIVMMPASSQQPAGSLGPTSKSSPQNLLPFRDPPSFTSIPGISSYQNSSKEVHYDRRQRDEREMEEDDLDRLLRELQESDSAREDKQSKIANLFHEVGQINKAVGTLVTILTDEENSDNEEESFRNRGGKPTVPY